MRELLDQPERRPEVTVTALVILAAAASAAIALGVSAPAGPHRGPFRVMETVMQVKVFLSTFNVLLLLALTWSYLSVYRGLPNRFAGSLVLVSVALLLYALASNPLVYLLFGFRGGGGLGPFTFLSDAFASVAVVVLLYQSLR